VINYAHSGRQTPVRTATNVVTLPTGLESGILDGPLADLMTENRSVAAFSSSKPLS